MPRTLITGGAGFLGSHLCDYLLDKNHEVICMDNLITGSLTNIKHIKSDRFIFIEHNVTNFIDIDGPLDYILHFASPASPIDYLEFPIPTLKVGSLGTHNTLGLAKKKKSVFLIASTSEVYGDPLIHPQTEDYWGNVNPVGPRGVYDEAKRFAEAITMAYHRYHNIDTKIVRIFNTYGPRMRLNDGRAIPNRLLISDINDPVNIGNPIEMTIQQMAEKILQATNSRSKILYKPLPEDDPKVRQPNIEKAMKYLDWEPQVKLDEGLKKTMMYFKAQLGIEAS